MIPRLMTVGKAGLLPRSPCDGTRADTRHPRHESCRNKKHKDDGPIHSEQPVCCVALHRPSPVQKGHHKRRTVASHGRYESSSITAPGFTPSFSGSSSHTHACTR